ncbi:MAG: hypothetical protein P0Y49_13420 [Candidatus Pedobacter colombiensis]|uniref:Uncharacterized protein n=1 Tax=Candidatus Pedobacter colombiensis TaxID=3121371 RepID=A0AAJ5W3F7_9SPHI|nr:hypothetical protein [Pedobacter sp.]WEK17798.1 MAG: hypothetical protein P0Y49_13420 [Pedobacter sp.]
MKKLAAILFLTIHLFSTNEVSQLMKLPVFFDHYAEHKILNPNISFFDFLTQHYIYDSAKDFDHERDMQLPFKGSDHFSAPNAPAFIPDSMVLFHVNPLQIISSKIYIADDSFIPSDFMSGIWQPPKSC